MTDLSIAEVNLDSFSPVDSRPRQSSIPNPDLANWASLPRCFIEQIRIEDRDWRWLVFLTASKRGEINYPRVKDFYWRNDRTRISGLLLVTRVSWNRARIEPVSLGSGCIETHITCILRCERIGLFWNVTLSGVQYRRSSSSSRIEWPFLKPRFSENLPENRYDNTGTGRCHPETDASLIRRGRRFTTDANVHYDFRLPLFLDRIKGVFQP